LDEIKKNFSRRDVENFVDYVFDGFNFEQENPHTNPFKNCQNCTIRNSNLKNCDWPEDFTVEKESCLVAHFEREIVQTEIEAEQEDGSTVIEGFEEVIEHKID